MAGLSGGAGGAVIKCKHPSQLRPGVGLYRVLFGEEGNDSCWFPSEIGKKSFVRQMSAMYCKGWNAPVQRLNPKQI